MTIGFAFTGSFCTYASVFPILKEVAGKYNTIPIFSQNSSEIDSRFGNADDFLRQAAIITGNAPIKTIAQAEPIGPRKLLDLLIIAPCTGNTMAKLAHSIADTPVTMAVKSNLRNNNPVVIAVSTNDALCGAAENIGKLMGRKHYYFVPFRQDNPEKKPTSMVADFSLIPDTIELALQGIQIQPMILGASE